MNRLRIMTGNAAPLTPTVAANSSVLSDHSRFAQRLRRRYASSLPLLPSSASGQLDHRDLDLAYSALRDQGMEVGRALRILRQLVMERLIHLDCDAGEKSLSLGAVTASVTHLAEFALNEACIEAFERLKQLHGEPLAANTGQCAQLWVMGMGKLGARELNVSSDIDLIYVYDQDGETTGLEHGRGRISNQEYFAKAVKHIYSLVGDTTDDGFVFRVDLALRPNGNSGPPAVSLGALEEYFQVQGREWERFAWLKSRVVAPRSAIQSRSAQALRAVVLPFVFRRYLDYGVFEALRVLHQQIRDHAARRSAGHPERANDVKLSRGGIREIEFIVQLLQVVRGGQFPELRTRPTLDALQRLRRAGLMTADAVDALSEAYIFLRRVEHRIQYLDDQQTHILPVNDGDLEWIAQTLGLADASAFLGTLNTHRERVALEFEQLLGTPNATDCKTCETRDGDTSGGRTSPQTNTSLDLDELSANWPTYLRERILVWRDNPRVLALREDSRARLFRLLQRTAKWLDGSEGIISEHAAVRLVDWLEPLLRRENYISLLLERPKVHSRLLKLLGAARWPARYLLQHPGVIDELANDTMLHERFDAAEFEQELEARRKSLSITGEDDDEALLNLLRRAHHAEVFRTLARDVEGQITVEQVADDLSAMADAVLRITVRWCWDRLKNRHRDEPQFAIIAYGKLGGKELGYGSDLDIVFVYEDDDERAPEVYAQLVRKLINWLTVKTSEGDLFEIDTALRPNGNSGLLITSFDSYANYQQQRGSNTAWTWEHQAMTRARFALGNEAMRRRFDAIRHSVITAPRDLPALAAEIIDMRGKVRSAHPVKADCFDVKHSQGGMVDAEFSVQYLVLGHAQQFTELAENTGNIALIQKAESFSLLPPGTGKAAAHAYRVLRHIQHRARLDEQSSQSDSEEATQARAAILQLWSSVFGGLS
jgi:glutamate-ammonia-ligase adenylyltransferase